MVAKPRLGPLAIQLVPGVCVFKWGQQQLLGGFQSPASFHQHQMHIVQGCLFCPSVLPSHLELLLFRQVLGFPWILFPFLCLLRIIEVGSTHEQLYFITLFLQKKKKKCRRNVLECISKMNMGFHHCSGKIKNHAYSPWEYGWGFPIYWSQKVCHCRFQSNRETWQRVKETK